MSEQLSPTQRRILRLMRDEGGGIAEFGQGRRIFKHGKRSDGTLVIFAYSYPEIFLARRGLIEGTVGKAHHYRISEKGLAAIAGEKL